jgi:16S rRNA A1518/A1519 N6-dimethyltransferase RsmA/KsgA/DIM1 with predicted DNA glycosylase/AP lyase activity
MQRCAIDPRRRAETLSTEDFLDLSTALTSLLDKSCLQE